MSRPTLLTSTEIETWRAEAMALGVTLPGLLGGDLVRLRRLLRRALPPLTPAEEAAVDHVLRCCDLMQRLTDDVEMAPALLACAILRHAAETHQPGLKDLAAVATT